jgi:hypothetical protein
MAETERRLYEAESRAADRLGSWKEIAAYLGVTVRTAQRWERERGLPAKRVPGNKGPVTALRSELQQWANSASSAASEPEVGRGGRSNSTQAPYRRFWHVMLPLIGLCCAIAATIIYSRSADSARSPLLAQLEGNRLLVSDHRGRLLWTHTFREVLDPQTQPQADWIWFGDLDGDGTVETLFQKRYQKGSVFAGQIVCLASDGSEKWTFTPGRALSSAGGENFAADFHAVAFKVGVLDSSKQLRIAVASLQDQNYPTQVALLSSSGNMVREYMHSGYIGFGNLTLADIDRDGRQEILLAGVSNGYRCATLVGLDAEEMEGASVEENQYFQLLDAKAGREKFRVLFPQSCINMVSHPLYNQARDIRVTGGHIDVGVLEAWGQWAATVFYSLDSDLRVLRVSTGDDFRNAHLQMYAQHQLDHPLTDDEVARFYQIRVIRASQLRSFRTD